MGFQLRLPALKQSLFSLGHVFSKHFYSLSFGLCNKSLSDVVPRICLCLTSAGTRASPGTSVCILHLSVTPDLPESEG